MQIAILAIQYKESAKESQCGLRQVACTEGGGQQGAMLVWCSDGCAIAEREKGVAGWRPCGPVTAKSMEATASFVNYKEGRRTDGFRLQERKRQGRKKKEKRKKGRKKEKKEEGKKRKKKKKNKIVCGFAFFLFFSFKFKF